MDSTFEEWHRSAGFTNAQQQAIAEARQRFHTPANGPTTKYMIGKIAVAIIKSFTDSNGMVERWPSHIRVLMNQFSRSAAGPDKEFESWARPRDLEKRKQAVSVWTSLLAFLVFNWRSYGADGALESMGLNLSWTLKDDIDAIRYYAKSGRSSKVLGELASTFFVKVIKDPTATPHTNPLAWWLAVLIQTEVLDDQPRWEVAALKDTLSFSQKLEAIDHYARVLILEDSFYRWVYMPGGEPRAERIKVQDSLNQVDIGWVDQDAERPPVDDLGMLESHRQVGSPEWKAYTEYIGPIFHEWLTDQTKGPMSTVIRLLHKKLGPPSYKKVYRVMMQIEENFTVDPTIADCYPAEEQTTATIEQANKVARRCIREELGSKSDSVKWDEVYDTRGMVRVRAIYRNEFDDARAVAWVEEVDSLIEDTDKDTDSLIEDADEDTDSQMEDM
jgi:hypothetical protein